MKKIKKNYDSPVKYIKMIFILILFLASSAVSLLIAFTLGLEEIGVAEAIKLRSLSFIIILIIAIYLYRKDLKRDWKYFKKTHKHDMKIAFKYWLVGIIIMLSVNFLLAKAGLSISNNEKAVREMLVAAPLISGLTTVLIGPILEELVFRHAFYSVIKNKFIFVLSSGIIFGGLHVIGSMNNVFDLFYLIPYSTLGICFALTMSKTKTVYPSIILHIWHNFILAFLNFLLSGLIL